MESCYIGAEGAKYLSEGLAKKECERIALFTKRAGFSTFARAPATAQSNRYRAFTPNACQRQTVVATLPLKHPSRTDKGAPNTPTE